jgi:hypothetical protein
MGFILPSVLRYRFRAAILAFIVPFVLSCLPPTEDPPPPPPAVEDLQPEPEEVETSAQERAAELSQPVEEWSEELIAAVLEGTGVAPGASIEGDAGDLTGTWTASLVDDAQSATERAQLVFDENGAVVELRIFSDELVEAVVLTFPQPAAKARATGRLLGTLVVEAVPGRFDITVVAVLDTEEDEIVTRTREVFQFVVTFGADGAVLIGSGRQTSEVIASTDPATAPGETSITTGDTELVRNLPPMANAGPDRNASDDDGDGVASVNLDGSGSTDPDGAIVAYVWNESNLQIADGPMPTVNLAVGTHTITLTVSDDRGATASDDVIITVSAGQQSSMRTIHVNKAATGADTGESWEDAFVNLQDALAIPVASGATHEVRIAEGVYTPAAPGGDRAATFQLSNGVSLLGGYRDDGSGIRRISPEGTILSGDLNGDDGGAPEASDENSSNVVSISVGNGSGAALLDLLTIESGNADSGAFLAGGGLLIDAAEADLRFCNFRSNRAVDGGAIAMVNQGTLNLANCTFMENTSTAIGGGGGGAIWANGTLNLQRCDFVDNVAEQASGGAVLMFGGDSTVTRCLFSGNTSGGFPSGGGGAIWNESSSFYVNCDFLGNTAAAAGGAVLCSAESPSFVNCVFSGNDADKGGALSNFAGTVNVINCSAANNSALVECGGICNGSDLGSILTLENTILWDNDVAGVSDEIAQVKHDTGVTDVFNSCVKGLAVLDTPGSGNIGADPLFDNALGPDGMAGTADDRLQLLTASPCIDAGNREALPADVADLDLDDDVTEPTPRDADNGSRVTGPEVEIGAFEI